MRNQIGVRELCVAAAAACGVFLMAGQAQAGWSSGETIETMTPNDPSAIGSWDRLDWGDVSSSLTPSADNNGDTYPDAVRFLGGQININEVYYRGAVHLEMDNVPTDAGVRLDTSAFQHQNFQSNMEHWSLAVAIWYDVDNFVSLQRVNATIEGGNGSGGYQRMGRIDGNFFRAGHCGPCANPAPAGEPPFKFSGWAMQGIELTETEIKFYASAAGVETWESTDFDGFMTLDLGLDMARPAEFTGPATLIVGKGWGGVGGDPWDQSDPSTANPKPIGIDSTRVNVVVPEPASLALLLGGGLVAFAARRRRG